MSTKSPRIEIGAPRMEPLAALHNASTITFTLPTRVASGAITRAALADAEVELNRAAAALETELEHARARLVEELASEGPRSTPGATIRAKRAELAAAKDDAEIAKGARIRCEAHLLGAITAHAESIADRLADLEASLLDRAEPLAAAVAGMRWSDPDSVHELSDEGQRSFHVLDQLAETHDVVRQGALGLWVHISSGRQDAARVDAAASFPIDRWVGSGLVGPYRPVRGTDDYAMDWRWKPRGHRIERLLEAVRRRAELEATAAEGELVTQAVSA